VIITDELKELEASVEYGGEEVIQIERPKLSTQNGMFDQRFAPLVEKIGAHFLPESFFVVLEDVHLCGAVLVGFKCDDVILDTAYFGRYDLVERNKPFLNQAIKCLKMPAEELDFVTSFNGVWGDNYFHWTLDFLPRLEAIFKYNDMFGEMPDILLAHACPYAATQSLDANMVKYMRITSLHYHVKRLLVITNRRTSGFLYPSAQRFLRSQVRNAPKEKLKLYITRNDTTTRRVVNEQELIPLLEKLGFKIISITGMSWAEQVQLFSQAEFVIGSHGAGLSNLAYSENPKVIELITPSYVNPCIFTIAAMNKWDYRPVMGEQIGAEDIKINPREIKVLYEQMV
jgi:hypothetical protein